MSSNQGTQSGKPNTLILLRHGESTANVASVIVSRPSIGVKSEHGLTAKGREQATNAGRQLNELSKASGQIPLVLSSDFSRAYETACIAADQIDGQPKVRVDTRLRERFFGAYDGLSSTLYESVWEQDVVLGTDEPQVWAAGAKGVESVYSVSARMSQVVKEVNAQFTNHIVCLVSHGDALQILQASSRALPPWQHRTLQHLGNCEVRTVPALVRNVLKEHDVA